MISCFQLKPCVKCVYKICLKDFKLKKLVVEPKTTQPVEPDEESIDPHLNRSRVWTVTSQLPAQPIEGCKKPSLSSRIIVQPDEEPVGTHNG